MRRLLLRLSSQRGGLLIKTLGPATCALASVKLQKYVAAISAHGVHILQKYTDLGALLLHLS